MTVGSMPDLSVLLVDDDTELGALMQEYFAQRGFRLEPVYDGARGLARALEGKFDLLLLDVMMPGLDGFEMLRHFRRRSQTPVIMLTARIEQRDRIAGLDAGADDYLPKPFSPEELLARIRAVLRRTGRPVLSADEIVEVNRIKLNIGARTVRYDGIEIDLTAIEFDILEILVRSAGRVVSRDELMNILHQREATPFERSVDVHVSHLRKKFDANRSLIRTIRGVGYQFTAGEND
jgi:two-component system, OmpR family, response regulator CpxR